MKNREDSVANDEQESSISLMAHKQAQAEAEGRW